MVIGAGSRSMKIRLAPAGLLRLPGAQVVDGLANLVEAPPRMTRLNAAAAHIVKVDPKFRRIVDTTPPMTVRPEAGSAFESLLSAIVFQQLAGAAARAIHGRLVTALGGEPVAPEAVLAAKPETHARSRPFRPTSWRRSSILRRSSSTGPSRRTTSTT